MNLRDMTPDLTDDERADYYAFLRHCHGGVEDHTERTLKAWYKSRRKGRFIGIVDRNRWKEFSPGVFHASSPAGVYLNGNFVRGSGAYRLKHGD